MYKNIQPTDITHNKSFDIINYNIGDGLKDFTLSSNVNGYIFTRNDASTIATFGYLKNFYYLNQIDSTSAFIIPTSYINNKVGNSTADTISLITFNKYICKDGISTNKPERNVEIYLNSISYNLTSNNIYIHGIQNSLTSQYLLYDVPNSTTGSITSGDLKLQIIENLSLSSNVDSFLNYGNVTVGKVFYDQGIIIIDSFYGVNVKQLSSTSTLYFVPYPVPDITNSNSSYIINYSSATSGIISYASSSNYSGIYFNNCITGNLTISNTITGSGTSYNVNNSLIIDKINVNFNVKKDTYTFNLLVDYDEFNYSQNKLLLNNSSNVPTIATDDNPIYFTKVGFYDYLNNLIAIGKISIPIKLSNDRQIKLKFRLDE